MNTINVGGHEIELYFNIKAMNTIADLCGGDVSKLGEKFAELEELQVCNLLCNVLCALANGAVAKKNCDISLGLSNGEKMQEFTPEFFEVNLDFSKGAELVDTLFTVINGGSQYTIPDNVQTVEKDIDLKEIEAEKEASEGNS